MNYEKIVELINLIKITRKEVNHEQYHVENADWRIKMMNSTDGMWHRIKEEHEVKLKEVNSKLQNLYREFYSLKETVSKEDWNTLLKKLGEVLAETENIEHVANSLYDEFDLNRALNEVEKTIYKKLEELETAREQKNEDAITIINEEINYHINDMSTHHWGQSRLEKMNENHNKGKGRI